MEVVAIAVGATVVFIGGCEKVRRVRNRRKNKEVFSLVEKARKIEQQRKESNIRVQKKEEEFKQPWYLKISSPRQIKKQSKIIKKQELRNKRKSFKSANSSRSLNSTSSRSLNSTRYGKSSNASSVFGKTSDCSEIAAVRI